MTDLPPPPPAMSPPPAPITPEPTTGRSWKTWHVVVAAVAGLALGVGVGGVMASEEEPDTALEAVERTEDDREADVDEEDATTTTEDDAGETTTTTVEDELGTRENPHPLGTELRSDDGLVVVVDAVRVDAAADIAAANQFNEPPPDGFTYVLMTFTVRNETDEPVDAGWALDVGLIGSANRMYDAGNAYCEAVIPNPLHDGGELFPGGTYQGNDCLQVPTTEVEDGSLVVAVTPMMSFDDPVFVATR